MGSRSAALTNMDANARKAEAQRKQLLAFVGKFRKQSKLQQERTSSRLEREYKRVAERLQKAGYEVPELGRLIEDKDAWSQLEIKPGTITKVANIGDLVEEAYLRTLSRFPDDDETQISVDFINASTTPADGMQSLLWALVNTKEFIITH